jgi:uncharacterized cupin superfamily protein
LITTEKVKNQTMKNNQTIKNKMNIPAGTVVLLGLAVLTLSGFAAAQRTEIIYVPEGLPEHRVDGKAPVTLKAGEVFFIPAGLIHAARRAGNPDSIVLFTF